MQIILKHKKKDIVSNGENRNKFMSLIIGKYKK